MWTLLLRQGQRSSAKATSEAEVTLGPRQVGALRAGPRSVHTVQGLPLPALQLQNLAGGASQRAASQDHCDNHTVEMGGSHPKRSAAVDLRSQVVARCPPGLTCAGHTLCTDSPHTPWSLRDGDAAKGFCPPHVASRGPASAHLWTNGLRTPSLTWGDHGWAHPGGDQALLLTTGAGGGASWALTEGPLGEFLGCHQAPVSTRPPRARSSNTSPEAA